MLELLTGEVRAGDVASRIGQLQRAAIAIGIWEYVAGRERAVADLIARSVDRQGPHRLAVETAPEPRHLELAGGILGEPEGALHRFGAARVQLQTIDALRSDLGDLGDEIGASLGGERSHRNLVDLRVQRLAVGRMA